MTQYIRHPEQATVVDIRVADGLFAKSTTFPCAGMIAPMHSHEYPHLSIIASGAVEVEKDGVPMGRFDAPAIIYIEAQAKHLFKTLDIFTTVVCVHNSDRCEAGEIAIHEEHQLDMMDEP